MVQQLLSCYIKIPKATIIYNCVVTEHQSRFIGHKLIDDNYIIRIYKQLDNLITLFTYCDLYFIILCFLLLEFIKNN